MPDEQPAEPKSPRRFLAKTWVDKKYVRWGIVAALVLLFMFSWFGPSAQPEQQQKRQGQPTQSVVTLEQVNAKQQELAQQKEQIRAKQEQLAKTKAAYQELAKEASPDTAGLDLSTPAGQAALQNRMQKRFQAQQKASTMPPYYGDHTEPKADKGRQSLLSSSIVFDRTKGKDAPEATTEFSGQPSGAANQGERESAVPSTKPEETKQQRPKSLLDFKPELAKYILPEGFVVESVLTNKLVGDAAGPVNVMLTTPVYAPGTHELLIPQGSRVLGEAKSVAAFGDSRLAVIFHRVLVHSGPRQYSIPLDQQMPGLDQQGAVGLKDKVNQHVLRTILMSGVIGAIAGLGEIGNYSNSNGFSPSSQFRAGVAQNMSQSSMEVLNQSYRQRPDIEIRPGTRVKLITTYDLDLPSFEDAIAAAGGGR